MEYQVSDKGIGLQTVHGGHGSEAVSINWVLQGYEFIHDATVGDVGQSRYGCCCTHEFCGYIFPCEHCQAVA